MGKVLLFIKVLQSLTGSTRCISRELAIVTMCMIRMLKEIGA